LQLILTGYQPVAGAYPVIVGTVQGSAATGGQAGTGAAQTAGAAGRKQLPQQPQPVVLAASAATAITIKNLFMFASPYCPL